MDVSICATELHNKNAIQFTFFGYKRELIYFYHSLADYRFASVVKVPLLNGVNVSDLEIKEDAKAKGCPNASFTVTVYDEDKYYEYIALCAQQSMFSRYTFAYVSSLATEVKNNLEKENAKKREERKKIEEEYLQKQKEEEKTQQEEKLSQIDNDNVVEIIEPNINLPKPDKKTRFKFFRNKKQ